MSLPVIVIPAYNRPGSLKRLLFSISNAKFNEYPLLIISIDGEGSKDVVKIAKDFDWPGPKEVFEHEQNKGLKEHILFCGDLTEKYNEIIILEEDLFVSRFFYDYAKKALTFYKADNCIGGISLYQYEYIEANDCPFRALVDGYDTYFIQTASSWGQAWNKRHWQEFTNWYSQNNKWDAKDTRLPNDVLSWPETSWKKYFIKYLVDTNRYFVFPRISLTTNFGDPGTNNGYKNTLHQVNLLIGEKYWQFVPLERAIKYDVFFNVSNLENFSVNSLLNPSKSEFELKPIELNITEGLNQYISKKELNKIKRKNYKEQFNLSYRTVQSIQNELPSLKVQVFNHAKYWFKKRFL